MAHPSLVALKNAQSQFEEIALTHQRLTFREEAGFAKQMIMASRTQDANKAKYALFSSDPETIESAIVRVASIGLTLNPAHKMAYLVPRFNSNTKKLECCLDISYQGLVQLAIESGVVSHVVAELVYEGDISTGAFQFRGPLEAPVHHGNPFANDRGNIIGVYCVAMLAAGGSITTHMRKDELDKIAALSKSPVWKKWYGEMAKKTCIKRAFKSWPKPRNDDRLGKAVEYLHQTEGFEEKDVATLEEQPKQRPMTAMERMIADSRQKKV